MPELPEVETVVREIRDGVVGRRILSARFMIPRQLAPQSPRNMARSLANRKISEVRRRGKYILITLDGGTLLIHLRMSGRLYVREDTAAPNPHERAIWSLDGGRALVLRDVRTLGTIRFFRNGEQIEPIASLGWEPLDEVISPEALHAALRSRRTAIKPLLLDQKLYAGIGNIYASESLWEAGISPRRRAMKLTRAECGRLAAAIPLVLERALSQGGSTLRDFMKPDGSSGSYQKEFRVYGREGEPCLRCSKVIRRIVQAQRSTYFCPACQK